MAWTGGGKPQVEDVCSVDIRRLQREGFIPNDDSLVRYFTTTWTCRGEQFASISSIATSKTVKLKYVYCKKQRVNSTIRLTRTTCNYGNARSWFVCPACERRCAILYLRGLPKCRTCTPMTYRSQIESHVDKHISRRDKINDLIDRRGGLTEHGQICKRPPGMHHKTFYRLLDEHQQHEHKF